VTALERRLQNLEAKYAELLPSLDIESILTSESTSPGFSSWSLADSGGESSRPRTAEAVKCEESSDLLPEASNGFEWVEGEDLTSQLSDGMAALSVDPQGVGFLGS
jgi:transcriptional regulatory protein GAL4